MCGIVGAVAQRDVVPILVEGLRRLEYRGYDSAGVAVLDDKSCLGRVRTKGKVGDLAAELGDSLKGHVGIAHTRCATHGVPSVNNAHPHICRNVVALIHNGIIENYEALREQQKKEVTNSHRKPTPKSSCTRCTTIMFGKVKICSRR